MPSFQCGTEWLTWWTLEPGLLGLILSVFSSVLFHLGPEKPVPDVMTPQLGPMCSPVTMVPRPPEPLVGFSSPTDEGLSSPLDLVSVAQRS